VLGVTRQSVPPARLLAADPNLGRGYHVLAIGSRHRVGRLRVRLFVPAIVNSLDCYESGLTMQEEPVRAL